MNSKCIKIILLSVSILIIISSVIVAFTNDISAEEYPVYENDLEPLSLQKVPDKVNQEVKDIKYALPIFMYHWVRDDTGGYAYPENMVRPETLRQQVEYIVNNGYEPIFMTEIDDITKYNKPVALTFDDGFICFYLYAYPILKQYNIKSTLFVITDYVGKEGYCTKEQLMEMKESGIVDIQAHTQTHPHLAWLSASEMHDQMNNCNTYLKNELGIDSTILCYPYGSYNASTIDEAKKMGYKYGIAMDGGVHYSNRDDKYEISRIYANRSMSINTFANYCSKSFVEVTW